jgi:hypothetical protein
MGATQIAYGFAQLLVALRYRSLTSLFLLLTLIERSLAAIAAWITNGSGARHHPLESYAVLVAMPLLPGFLVLSLRPRN